LRRSVTGTGRRVLVHCQPFPLVYGWQVRLPHATVPLFETAEPDLTREAAFSDGRLDFPPYRIRRVTGSHNV
jgi:hypothetical protein